MSASPESSSPQDPPEPASTSVHDRLAEWFRGGGAGSGGGDHAHEAWPWYRVLWLTGVDYFSTLGYQPGIALLAAGALSPVATLVLVLVTLFAALPIYRDVARRSFDGQGSISMLERLLPNWWGKLLVLALIGFATTDFIITMTLSAADAAQHAVENPHLHPYLEGHQFAVTVFLLAMLTLVFLKGFREAVGLATWIAVPYLVLNAVVIGRGAMELSAHPDKIAAWKVNLWQSAGGDWTALALMAVLTFPKLALGLSGFETGVTVMPQVAGGPGDVAGQRPEGRIRNTGRLLTAAALIMSLYLIGSSLVTTMLIPAEAVHGDAEGRALAYLAHTLLGPNFGTLYDLSTLLILWFAGASAMAALLNLIPRYLPRFGMAPQWVSYGRALVLTIFSIDVIVTWVFDADVEKQGGAYATGVLALMFSASLAVMLAHWREARVARTNAWIAAAPWAAITGVFAFTFGDNVIERPDGAIISSIFIVSIIVLGAASRWWRATELRVEHAQWANADSEDLFEEIRGRGVYIVTLRDPEGVLERRRSDLGMDTRYAIFTAHRNRILQHYRVPGPFCFVHVDLDPDESRFGASLDIRMKRVGDDYVMVVKHAAAVANAIAWVSEETRPAGIFLGLTQEDPMRQALQYLVFGKGETGILVYQILLRRWEELPPDAPRPTLYLMSDARRHPRAERA